MALNRALLNKLAGEALALQAKLNSMEHGNDKDRLLFSERVRMSKTERDQLEAYKATLPISRDISSEDSVIDPIHEKSRSGSLAKTLFLDENGYLIERGEDDALKENGDIPLEGPFTNLSKHWTDTSPVSNAELVEGRLENMRQITKPTPKLPQCVWVVSAIDEEYAGTKVFGVFTSAEQADNLLWSLWDERGDCYFPTAMVEEVPLNVDIWDVLRVG